MKKIAILITGLIVFASCNSNKTIQEDKADNVSSTKIDSEHMNQVNDAKVGLICAFLQDEQAMCVMWQCTKEETHQFMEMKDNGDKRDLRDYYINRMILRHRTGKFSGGEEFTDKKWVDSIMKAKLAELN